jgi:hypothetical protein
LASSTVSTVPQAGTICGLAANERTWATQSGVVIVTSTSRKPPAMAASRAGRTGVGSLVRGIADVF